MAAAVSRIETQYEQLYLVSLLPFKQRVLSPKSLQQLARSSRVPTIAGGPPATVNGNFLFLVVIQAF